MGYRSLSGQNEVGVKSKGVEIRFLSLQILQGCEHLCEAGISWIVLFDKWICERRDSEKGEKQSTSGGMWWVGSGSK